MKFLRRIRTELIPRKYLEIELGFLTSKFCGLFLAVVLLFLSNNCFAISNTDELQQLKKTLLQEMILVPGGKFVMGSPIIAQHRHLGTVSLTGFYLQKYPVLQSQYATYQQQPKKNNWLPVAVTYQQANAFCHWLANASKLPVSLASEAQWEYAARDGGLNILFPTNNGDFDNGRNAPDIYAIRLIHNAKSPYDYQIKRPYQVNAYPANKLGIYALTGYNSEWVKDFFHLLPTNNIKNPVGPSDGLYHTIRGGNLTNYQLVYDLYQNKIKFGHGRYEPATAYQRTWVANPNAKFSFRCAINTDQALS